jgi:uncharacterized SAM-binding protein YcdF (DUF218 family)
VKRVLIGAGIVGAVVLIVAATGAVGMLMMPIDGRIYRQLDESDVRQVVVSTIYR